jgi:sulfatase maturation enzyme AslB (radical SAM superfamily)
MQPFTLLIKPSGSDCNVACEYCFYRCRARGDRQAATDEDESFTGRQDYMAALPCRFCLAGASRR